VLPDSGIVVEVNGIGCGAPFGYVYLFINDGSLPETAERRYGAYDYTLLAGTYPDDFGFCHGPNPEDSWFTSEHYQRHFSDRWYDDVMQITTTGATGVDILDRHHVNGYGSVEGCSVETFRSMEGAFVTNKSGPVRSIRSYVGSASGPLSQRTHIFYERREDIISDLRVHSMPAGAISDFFDFAPEATGMRRYNCANLEGLSIDGTKDEVGLVQINSQTITSNEAWKMVSGEQGSLVIVHTIDTDLDYNVGDFYRDDAAAASDMCGSDSGWYGSTGFIVESPLACTDAGCDHYIHSVRTLYYQEPNLTPVDAAQLARWVYQPLIAIVSPASP
jgi:hypothetical protein